MNGAELITVKVSEAQLKEIVDNTQKFMKSSLANTVEVPVDIAKKSVLVDFPFMSNCSFANEVGGTLLRVNDSSRR